MTSANGLNTTGKIVLFGSGETGKHGRFVQEQVLSAYRKPVRVAILETPAGFQPNVDVVTAKLRTFYEHNLQNFKPVVTSVPARRRGGEHDPDDPAVAGMLVDQDVIFAGPGSPTYVVRQLAGSATLVALRERFRQGATVVLASAAAAAAGCLTIPVYELFKVGDDPAWTPGLDLLAEVGLRAVVVPHWNNAEGGADLDTTHCYIGVDRFNELLRQLPPGIGVLGIDEHTAVVLDAAVGTGTVRGAGTATLVVDGVASVVPSGERFLLSSLGSRAVHV
jgi:cyanophycinase-like exopeptidase